MTVGNSLQIPTLHFRQKMKLLTVKLKVRQVQISSSPILTEYLVND